MPLAIPTFEDTDYRYSDLTSDVVPFASLYKPPVAAVQLNCMK